MTTAAQVLHHAGTDLFGTKILALTTPVSRQFEAIRGKSKEFEGVLNMSLNTNEIYSFSHFNSREVEGIRGTS